jgi:nucleotide-binding universal stress UspA family protein
MQNGKRILVAVDGSAGSRRTVAYVADVVGGSPGFHVGLLHLELPPGMLEWGGSEDPEVEDEVSSERAEAYREMEGEATEKGRELLRRLQRALSDGGTDVAELLVQFEKPLDAKNTTHHILKTAVERDYGTVVVGRHTFSGLKRLFQHHVAEELIRTAKGVTVWVVE